MSDQERDRLLNGPFAVEVVVDPDADPNSIRFVARAHVLAQEDVLAVLLREVADAAFRAGVHANEGMPTLGELKAAREAHVEEVIERWRSASSDKR